MPPPAARIGRNLISLFSFAAVSSIRKRPSSLQIPEDGVFQPDSSGPSLMGTMGTAGGRDAMDDMMATFGMPLSAVVESPAKARAQQIVPRLGGSGEGGNFKAGAGGSRRGSSMAKKGAALLSSSDVLNKVRPSMSDQEHAFVERAGLLLRGIRARLR